MKLRNRIFVSRRQVLKTGLVAATSLALGENKASASNRFLGVTVFPEYIQSEGIDGVLQNLLEKVRANAVALSPYVMAETNPSLGKREPPADAGAGAVRHLDRPLFGKREVWVTTAPSFVPTTRLYQGLRYTGAPASDLTYREGSVVGRFIKTARQAGLKVYLQVQAAIPPGYRVQFGGPVDEDKPRLPDGRIPPRRLALNGSLASFHILDYEHALIKEMCHQYPDIDGLRFDWPEYPPYFLDSVFLDFGVHARSAAKRLGFDFEAMRVSAEKLYKKLHGELKDSDLLVWSEGNQTDFHLLSWLIEEPPLMEWLRFKATLVEEMLGGFRETINGTGGSHIEMMPNAFPPPWTLVSGFDFGRAASHSTAICVKHYTMHWPMMLRFYADQLRQANPGISDRLLAQFLVRLLDIADDGGLPSCDDYRYPAPDEPHPVGTQALGRKLRQAQRHAGLTPILGLVHGYGPLDDFRRRLAAAWQASNHGIWVNRYAYLDDRKLEMIGEVCGS